MKDIIIISVLLLLGSLVYAWALSSISKDDKIVIEKHMETGVVCYSKWNELECLLVYPNAN